MADGTRTTGWYPDPWGTAHERYFDGSAWTHQTRVVGATDAVIQWPPTGSPDVTGDAPADASGPMPAPGTAPDTAPGASAGAPPGWHPDPWRLAALRWWDGTTWTGHVSGPPPQNLAVDIVGERALARWAQPLLLVGGLVQAAGMFANAEQAKWVIDHWDEFTRPGASMPSPPNGNSLAGFVFPITIAVAALFMVWFYRAARTGWASGLPARRSPLLATLSFLIPILQWWWPYQAAMDMVPANDSHRVIIQRWWLLWLLATLCGYLIYPAQAIYDETAARIVAAVGAIAMVGAGIAARSVVAYVTEAHERLGGAAAAG